MKQLVADYNLIVRNCIDYNGDDNEVAKLAMKMDQKCQPILRKELNLDDGELIARRWTEIRHFANCGDVWTHQLCLCRSNVSLRRTFAVCQTKPRDCTQIFCLDLLVLHDAARARRVREADAAAVAAS